MTNRAKEATVKQDPATGLWGFVIDLGPGNDAAGTWRERRQVRRRGFEKMGEAKAALNALRKERDEGTHVPRSRLTLQQFLVGEWLPAVKGSLEPSTWASYDRAIRLRVLPTLGPRLLQGIMPSDLNKLYAELLADGGRSDDKDGGLSPRSVRYTHTILNRALRDAVRWQRLAISPAVAAEPPSASSARAPEMKTWTGAELHQFLHAERESRYWIGWRLLATTGMRRGEALGARWSDVDLETGTLTIVQTITAVDHKIRTANRTKTGKGRVLQLDADTVAALRSWRSRQVEERLLHGEGYDVDADLILCHPDGRPYHPDRFSREFDRRVERHGLRRIRLHDLRHTWATLALVAGVHPKVVSEQLGHASIAITLDTYSHATAAQKTGAVDLVAGLIVGG